jgi:hypothetical protein
LSDLPFVMLNLIVPVVVQFDDLHGCVVSSLNRYFFADLGLVRPIARLSVCAHYVDGNRPICLDDDLVQRGRGAGKLGFCAIRYPRVSSCTSGHILRHSE